MPFLMRRSKMDKKWVLFKKRGKSQGTNLLSNITRESSWLKDLGLRLKASRLKRWIPVILLRTQFSLWVAIQRWPTNSCLVLLKLIDLLSKLKVQSQIDFLRILQTMVFQQLINRSLMSSLRKNSQKNRLLWNQFIKNQSNTKDLRGLRFWVCIDPSITAKTFSRDLSSGACSWLTIKRLLVRELLSALTL